MPPCDGVKYTRTTASDGIGIGVVAMGTGKRGVLMLPEYQASACEWAVEANGLVSAGFRVLLLEYRCTPPSDCPSDTDKQTYLSLDAQAGVAALHAAGATKVVIVGASAGGTLAVVAGAAAGPLVNGVVDLSGPADVSALFGTAAGAIDSHAAAPHLNVPSLFVVSKDDPSTSVDEITGVYNAVPDKTKQLMVLPAEGGHGWDTLAYSGPEGNVQTTLYTFLRAND
jgi:dienelactone hydrolase